MYVGVDSVCTYTLPTLELKPLTVYALDDHVDIPRHECVGNHFTTETEPAFALWQTRNVFHNRFVLHYVYFRLFFPLIYVHFNPLPPDICTL